MEKTKLSRLFLSFAKIGAFTFGGGYAMLPMLQKEVVEKQKWITETEMLDYYAVSQCTPGVVAVNTATFIGYRERGILGGIITTAGVITPSLLIILVIAAFLNNFADNPYVIHALAGIKVAVSALVVNAVINLWKKGVKDLLGVCIFALTLGLCLFLPISPIWVVVTAIVFGLLYGRFAPKRKAAKAAAGASGKGQAPAETAEPAEPEVAQAESVTSSDSADSSKSTTSTESAASSEPEHPSERGEREP